MSLGYAIAAAPDLYGPRDGQLVMVERSFKRGFVSQSIALRRFHSRHRHREAITFGSIARETWHASHGGLIQER